VTLLYMTHARATEMLRAMLIDGLVCVAAILVGLTWNVVGVAAALAIASVVVRLPLAFWLASRRGPVSMLNLVTAIAPAVCTAVAGAATAWLLRHYAFPGVDPMLPGVLVVGAGAALAMMLVVLAWPETRRELFNMARWSVQIARPQA
jgi:polysaccharide transporter, PST family